MTAQFDPDHLAAAVAALLGRPVVAVDATAEPIDPHLRCHTVTGGVVGSAAAPTGRRSRSL